MKVKYKYFQTFFRATLIHYENVFAGKPHEQNILNIARNTSCAETDPKIIY